jgi:SAM-dependent methyltransferase
VQAAAEALPFKDNSFDTALMLEVLEHVEDVEAALKEALRVARRVIISYPDESYDECKVRRPDINAFIRSLIGLREAYAEGEIGFRAHYHWKTRDRILRDIELLRRHCQLEFKLQYPDYDGWGFICGRQA